VQVHWQRAVTFNKFKAQATSFWHLSLEGELHILDFHWAQKSVPEGFVKPANPSKLKHFAQPLPQHPSALLDMPGIVVTRG